MSRPVPHSRPHTPAAPGPFGGRRFPAVVLAAIGAASLALTGCSGTHAGAAAIVDGNRIDISAVNAAVAHSNDALESTHQTVPAGVTASHDQLVNLIDQRVLDTAAQRMNITVTQTDIVTYKHQVEAAAGQPIAQVAAANGVGPADVDTAVRYKLIGDRIAASQGAQPGTAAAQEVLTTVLTDTAQSMKITVNPRYGTWSADALDVNPSSYAWLTPKQLTPPTA